MAEEGNVFFLVLLDQWNNDSFSDSARKAAELVPAMRKGILDELQALKLLQDQPDSADAYRAAQEIVKKRGLEFAPHAIVLDHPIQRWSWFLNQFAAQIRWVGFSHQDASLSIPFVVSYASLGSAGSRDL
ncbi:hypothetical protein SAMN04515647_3453 [Cohaesibacter sp. ES.047]|nr:hypothetical protein SAMN04515647_3453 [Cohaesibacter sp. ES.047]